MTSRFQFDNGQPNLKKIRKFIDKLAMTNKKYELAREFTLTIHGYPTGFTSLDWVKNKFPEFPTKYQKLVVYHCSL
jgi:hypothetical protein